ncbi:hypothetical protein KR084_008980 [Drosophila pseudotakahashii]|nr:hypothetical protein KR084_008980 [Drosophila pseudotakahashii]
MKLKTVDYNDSSDDEGDEEMHNDNPASEESDLGEEEEQLEEDEEKEMEDDEEEQDGEEQGPESDGARHPYPTPPPDDGSKMAAPKSMVPKPKGTLISLALMAIGKLASRSGSSVKAIMSYLKDNGHDWPDPKKTERLMYRALKVAEGNEEVFMVKRSFKLTNKQKNSSKAVEKMKAKKQKDKEREKEKEKKAKAKAEQRMKEKAEKKEAKKMAKAMEKKAAKEKSSKPTERKTKQAGKKKKEDGAKDQPPASKTAASAAVQAMLETPRSTTPGAKKKPAKSKSKVDEEPSEAGKAKKPRKSIGTLAQPKTSRPKVKAVKKLVAGKALIHTPDPSSDDISKPQAMSTPQEPAKAKRLRKA